MKAKVTSAKVDRVIVNDVTFFVNGPCLYLYVDTQAKWPSTMEIESDDKITVNFYEDDEKTGLSCSVEFVPTNKKERAVFKKSYLTKVSGRYGALYVMSPKLDENSKAKFIYERPKDGAKS